MRNAQINCGVLSVQSTKCLCRASALRGDFERATRIRFEITPMLRLHRDADAVNFQNVLIDVYRRAIFAALCASESADTVSAKFDV